MKILFDGDVNSPTYGKLYYARHGYELTSFAHTTNIPLIEFVVEEIDENGAPINVDYRIDLRRMVKVAALRDINELEKYHAIDNAGEWEIHEREDWEPVIDDE